MDSNNQPEPDQADQPPINPPQAANVVQSQSPQTITPEQPSANPQVIQPTAAPTAPERQATTVQQQPVQQQPVQQQPVQQQPPAQPNATGMVTPSLNNAYLDKTTPGITIGVLALVFAILIPIVGLILGIVAIVKGFKRNSGNKKLGVLGIVAVVVSIIVTVVGVIYVLNSSKVTYSEMTTYNGSYVGINDVYNYSFDYPVEFDDDSSDVVVSNITFLQHKSDKTDDGEVKATSKLLVLVNETVKIDASNFDRLVDEVINKDTLTSQLESIIKEYYKLDDVDVQSPTTSIQQNHVDATYDFTASAQAVGNDTTVQLTGRYLVRITDAGVTYDLSVLSLEDVWENNLSIWTQIFDSFTNN